MESTVTLMEKKQTQPITHRVFIVGIHREGKKVLVRKSELIHGIRVVLDETYVLDIENAIWLQSTWMQELTGFHLN